MTEIVLISIPLFGAFVILREDKRIMSERTGSGKK